MPQPGTQISAGVSADHRDLTVDRYKPTAQPRDVMTMMRMFSFELNRISRAMDTLVRAAVTVAYSEPDKPQVGMLRFARAPWDPIGAGYEGLVVYNEAGLWERVR